MNYFETNKALLSIRQPELADQLSRVSMRKVTITVSASGLPTAAYAGEATAVALHNRYHPLREAHQQLKKYDCSGADYFTLLGFGLGYLLDAAVENFPDPANHFFIVESDPEILRAAFEARDLTHLLARHNIHFAWPASGTDLAVQWQKFFDPVLAQKNIFLTHLPSVSLNPDFYKSAVEIIQSQIFQTFTDINTMVAQSQTFLDNFVKNFVHAAAVPGISAFSGQFTGNPAIIVSAGPSLDKNIHELRGCEDRVLILSTDTALKPLLRAGIEPHFILSGDPSLANYLHLKDSPTRDALLVAEATSYPSCFEEFAGKTIVCAFAQSSLKSLSSLLESKGSLRAWGSVATMALDFALVLGCNPIIFIGQDLAYTDRRIYCSGVYFEKEWFQGVTNPDEYRKQCENLCSQRLTATVEDIFGQPQISTDKLTAYWNWMLKEINLHPDVRFINATEGGILRGAPAIMSLREAIFRYCGKSLNIRPRIQNLFRNTPKSAITNIKDRLALFGKEHESIQSIINQGFAVCRSEDSLSPRVLMQELEKINDSIYRHPHIAPLTDNFNQMGNVNFLRERHRLRQSPQDQSITDNIKKVYADFYLSYQNALTIVGNALFQLQSAIRSSENLSSEKADKTPSF